MRRRPIAFVSAEKLEGLPTKQLLARLDQLRRCEESASLSDCREDEIPSGIVFKETPEWSTAYDQLKKILARREHVAKGTELVIARKRRATLARTVDRRVTRRT